MKRPTTFPGLRAQVPLAPRTTLQVGGAAQFFLEARSEAGLIGALRWAADRGLPVQVVGGGSNLLVADAGVAGLVVQVGLLGRAATTRADAVEVRAAAGEPWDALVAWTVERGWGGVECLAGIPGRVGAAPIQNIGAYGQEVGERLAWLRAFDREADALVTLAAGACDFGYRHSRFKAQPGRFVVLEVALRLTPGATGEVRYAQLADHLGTDTPSLAATRDAVLALRRGKSMVLDAGDPNHRSAGSFFLNPRVSTATADAVAAAAGPEAGRTMPRWPAADGEKLSAAWLIQRAGMAPGFGEGPVGLSTKHTLALVNRGGATAADVVAFAAAVRRRVHERFGVWLQPEPVFLGFDAPVAELLDGA